MTYADGSSKFGASTFCSAAGMGSGVSERQAFSRVSVSVLEAPTKNRTVTKPIATSVNAAVSTKARPGRLAAFAGLAVETRALNPLSILRREPVRMDGAPGVLAARNRRDRGQDCSWSSPARRV